GESQIRPVDAQIENGRVPSVAQPLSAAEMAPSGAERAQAVVERFAPERIGAEGRVLRIVIPRFEPELEQPKQTPAEPRQHQPEQNDRPFLHATFMRSTLSENSCTICGVTACWPYHTRSKTPRFSEKSRTSACRAWPRRASSCS